MKIFVKRTFFSFFLVNGYLVMSSFFLNHFFSNELNSIIALCLFCVVIWIIQTIGSQPELEWASVVSFLALSVSIWFSLGAYGTMIELNAGEWVENVSPNQAHKYPHASFFKFENAALHEKNMITYQKNDKGRIFSVTPLTIQDESHQNYPVHCWVVGHIPNFEQQSTFHVVVIHNTFKQYQEAIAHSSLPRSENPVLVYLIPSLQEVQYNFLQGFAFSNGMVIFLLWAGYTRLRFLRQFLVGEEQRF